MLRYAACPCVECCGSEGKRAGYVAVHTHLRWRRTESEEKRESHADQAQQEELSGHEGAAEKSKPSTGSMSLSAADTFYVAIGTGWVFGQGREACASRSKYRNLLARAPGVLIFFYFFVYRRTCKDIPSMHTLHLDASPT